MQELHSGAVCSNSRPDEQLGVVLAVLRKHKILGTSVPGQEITDVLSGIFFQKMHECNASGVLMGYDELIKFTAAEKDVADISKNLMQNMFTAFGNALESYLIMVQTGVIFLYLKYTREAPESLIVGPLQGDGGAECFLGFWGSRAEHRRFEDGRVRACVSWPGVPRHALPYLILSRLVPVEVTDGVLTDGVLEEKKENRSEVFAVLGSLSDANISKTVTARICTPCITYEDHNLRYRTYNRQGADEGIRRALDGARDSLPVKIVSFRITGGLIRRTRAKSNSTARVYLKIGKGYTWPKSDADGFHAALTALCGVLGKALEAQKVTVESVTEDASLLVTYNGERAELILDVEEEQALKPQKYSLMRFREEYELFFQRVIRKQDKFAETCVTVKHFLNAHGFFPNHIGNKAVEILCYRTSSQVKTPGAALLAFLSTEYASEYALDIRKGRDKIRACAAKSRSGCGSVSVNYLGGIYNVPLPSGSVMSRMNETLKASLGIAQSGPGISGAGYAPGPFLRNAYIPRHTTASFFLSRRAWKGYEEARRIRGVTEEIQEDKCFDILQSLGCEVYFMGTDALAVYVTEKSMKQIDMLVGISLLYTNMKFLKCQYEVPEIP